MSLNQTITITTVYQTHSNNNYPKHNTLAINMNKINKIDTVFDYSPSKHAPPQNSTPPQEQLLLKNFSPFGYSMTKP